MRQFWQASFPLLVADLTIKIAYLSVLLIEEFTGHTPHANGKCIYHFRLGLQCEQSILPIYSDFLTTLS